MKSDDRIKSKTKTTTTKKYGMLRLRNNYDVLKNKTKKIRKQLIIHKKISGWPSTCLLHIISYKDDYISAYH